MKAINILLFVILYAFAMGCATGGLLAWEFWGADRGKDALGFGIVFGWFLTVVLFIFWRDRTKKEDEEWRREQRDRNDKG
jgi:hypothetical protein